MEDLLQSQIQDSCKLALPEGLKDLMSDISREVLRAQPKDISKFISNYLGALLEAREALYIASHMCSYLCNCLCHVDFDHEIREIGLTEEDVATIKQVIQQQVEPGRVNEKNIFTTLTKTTSFDGTQLEAIQAVIRRAFELYKLNHSDATIKTELFIQPETHQDQPPDHVLDQFASPPGTTFSASTLAGSHVKLPQHRPYSVHDHDSYSLFSEKIHWSYDHTFDTTDKLNNTTWDSKSLDSGLTFVKEIPSNIKKIDTHFIRTKISHLKGIEEANDCVEDDSLSNDASNDSNISAMADNLDAESLHFISKIRD